MHGKTIKDQEKKKGQKMEEIRVKYLEKYQKKVDTLVDDLELLHDAQMHVSSGSAEDNEACAEIREAVVHLRNASYRLLKAIVAAEGGEITDRMLENLERLQMAAKES